MFFTGFADEASPTIDGQIEVLKALGWKNLEARLIEGKSIHDIPEEKFDEVCCKLADAGIRVNCLGSSVANWNWDPLNDEHYELTKAQLERAIREA